MCPLWLLFPPGRPPRGYGYSFFPPRQLLSAARLVASQRAHPLDEAAYAGLVTFVPLDQIAATHRAWANMTSQSRAARQLEVWELFRKRFAPPRLFADAGIYEALLSVDRAYRS